MLDIVLRHPNGPKLIPLLPESVQFLGQHLSVPVSLLLFVATPALRADLQLRPAVATNYVALRTREYWSLSNMETYRALKLLLFALD